MHFCIIFTFQIIVKPFQTKKILINGLKSMAITSLTYGRCKKYIPK